MPRVPKLPFSEKRRIACALVSNPNSKPDSASFPKPKRTVERDVDGHVAIGRRGASAFLQHGQDRAQIERPALEAQLPTVAHSLHRCGGIVARREPNAAEHALAKRLVGSERDIATQRNRAQIEREIVDGAAIALAHE